MLALALATLAVATPSSCNARTITVAFDPRGNLAVTAAGATLARATYRTRSAVSRCARVVTVSPPHAPKPQYRRVTITCRVKRPLEIEAHAISPTGSQVIVAERGSSTWLVSAVLKPGGSRVYVFSDACVTR